MADHVVKKYSSREETANIITHAIGILLAIAGLVLLVVFSATHGDAWKVTSSAIYGASMIVLYTASTLYHTFKNEKTKKTLNIVDHISIYYLIAGSYTPFMLVTIRGGWGWSIFGVVWALAITGTILKLKFGDRLRKFSNMIYIFMGWIIVIAIKPIINSLDPKGLALLFIGGVFYTSGVVFYKWKKLPYNHAIWHMFVLAGSVSIYLAILFYVVLGNA